MIVGWQHGRTAAETFGPNGGEPPPETVAELGAVAEAIEPPPLLDALKYPDIRDDPAFEPDDGRFAPALDKCVATFRSWLHFPDPGPLYVTLAAVVANRELEDDPVWALIVGSPGTGKTEILNAIIAQPDVYPAGTLTEPSLLSGTPKKDRSAKSKGGLLREIGSFGILVCKDFGSVMSMNRDPRGQLLAALREIYDGAWTRNVGTEGGMTLTWEGKIGLIGGCTPAIDSHHAVMGAMGERFALYRVSTTEDDEREQSRRALGRLSDRDMRQALIGAVEPVLTAASLDGLPHSPDLETTEWLVDLSTLAVRCRSSVDRDGYSREIELVPDPEMPARLALVLWRLLRAMTAIGVPLAEARRLTAKVALDSMPALRSAVLNKLPRDGSPVATTKVASSLGYPTTTARRALEDLAAHRVVRRHQHGPGKSDEWTLSEWTMSRLRAIAVTVPEMSVGDRERAPEAPGNGVDPASLTYPPPALTDISGTPSTSAVGDPEFAKDDDAEVSA
jgi:hypothetical protein